MKATDVSSRMREQRGSQSSAVEDSPILEHVPQHVKLRYETHVGTLPSAYYITTMDATCFALPLGLRVLFLWKDNNIRHITRDVQRTSFMYILHSTSSCVHFSPFAGKHVHG